MLLQGQGEEDDVEEVGPEDAQGQPVADEVGHVGRWEE